MKKSNTGPTLTLADICDTTKTVTFSVFLSQAATVIQYLHPYQWKSISNPINECWLAMALERNCTCVSDLSFDLSKKFAMPSTWLSDLYCLYEVVGNGLESNEPTHLEIVRKLLVRNIASQYEHRMHREGREVISMRPIITLTSYGLWLSVLLGVFYADARYVLGPEDDTDETAAFTEFYVATNKAIVTLNVMRSVEFRFRFVN